MTVVTGAAVVVEHTLKVSAALTSELYHILAVTQKIPKFATSSTT